MRNFVDYNEQDRILPSLFIGYVGWPYGWKHDFRQGVVFHPDYTESAPVPVEVELPEMIAVTEHQTAGHLCNHLQLFGVFFALNDLELYRVAERYGYEDLWAPVKWQELIDWLVAIKPFGLRFEHTEYQHMQEAFMPFGEKSAFEYARRKNLHEILPTGGRGEKCKKLWSTYEDLHKYLHDAYETARVWRPDGDDDPWSQIAGCVYPPPCGAIVYENSD